MEEIAEYLINNPYKTGAGLFVLTNLTGAGLYAAAGKVRSKFDSRVAELDNYADGYEHARRGCLNKLGKEFSADKEVVKELENALERQDNLGEPQKAYLDGAREFID